MDCLAFKVCLFQTSLRFVGNRPTTKNILSGLAGRTADLSYERFQIFHDLAVFFRILNLAPGTVADISAYVDDEYLVRHVDLAFVYIIQHLLGTFRPDFIVTGVAEETDADDDVSFKRKAFLRLKKLLLEASTAAECYDFVFADHWVLVIFVAR